MTDDDEALIDLARDPSPCQFDAGSIQIGDDFRLGATSGSPVSGERTPLIPGLTRAERHYAGFSGELDDVGRPQDGANGSFEHMKDDFQVDTVAPGGERSQSIRTLGVLAGVFCPVLLSMLSTLLFLRIGFLLGQAGLFETLLQFGLAFVIIFMTILSICAISTNGAVEGGGAYFSWLLVMISRALGPEFGGSIGLLFFLAQVCSCAMSISGFVEALVDNFGKFGTLMGDSGHGMPSGTQWWNYLYCSSLLALCLCVSLIGGNIFGKTNVFTLFVALICGLTVFISSLIKGPLCVSYPASNHNYTIVNNTGTPYQNMSCANDTALYTGFSVETFRENLYSNYTVDYLSGKRMSFSHVFAVLFSSITGIMNGANMSGDLKEPSKAIPKGTLAAAFVALITYIVESFMCSATASRQLLVGDYNYIESVNVWPPFVVIGIFATMLSAALGNLIGGSRILHALAKDEIFWFFLRPAMITTKRGNPVIAVIMAWFLVQLVLLVGSLNAIAPMCSELFLLGYASTNLACLALELSSAPNFRPMFKYFSKHTAFLGMIGSLIMCFLVDAIYASIAISVLVVLVLLLHLRGFKTSWGSISQALLFHQVRKYLLLLDSRKDHIKFWRPQIILLVSNPRGSCQLIDFVNDLKKSGLYVIAHARIGRLDDEITDPLQAELPKWLRLVDRLKVKAFVELTMSSVGIRDGVQQLIRIAGIGGMKPNTVCFGFYDDSPPTDDSFERLCEAKHLRRRLFGRWRLGGGGRSGGEEMGGSREGGREFQEFPQFTQWGAAEADGRKQLTAVDYVLMINDALKLNKNVCLCRHFDRLDKALIASSARPRHKMHIDVWPFDFFTPYKTGRDRFDATCFFVLQLACILHMSAEWCNRTVVRVFTCVRENREEELIGRDEEGARGEGPRVREEEGAEREENVKIMSEFLRDLRIRGKIKTVQWDSVLARLRPVGGQNMRMRGGREGGDTKVRGRRGGDMKLTDGYLTAVSEMIQEQCANTAVVFLYLPRPPNATSKSTVPVSPNTATSRNSESIAQPCNGINNDRRSNEANCAYGGAMHSNDIQGSTDCATASDADLTRYLRQLDVMTACLPSTILVHGVQPVTSTSL